MTLPVADHAVRLARQATRDALATWRLPHLEETAILLVSELVTNAVRHARGTYAISLELETAGIWLRIEVQDADPRWPRPRTPGGFDESGFGFVLVDALASKWGVRETATGKAVWAELGTRQGDEPGTQAGQVAERSATYVVVPGSGHAVHHHSPALVADAILDLVSCGK